MHNERFVVAVEEGNPVLNAAPRTRPPRSLRAAAALDERASPKPVFFQVDSVPPPVDEPIGEAPRSAKPPRNSHIEDLRALTAGIADRPSRRPDADLITLGGGLLLDPPLMRPPSVPRDLATPRSVFAATSIASRSLIPRKQELSLAVVPVTMPINAADMGTHASWSNTRTIAAGGTMTIITMVLVFVLARGSNDVRFAATAPCDAARTSSRAFAASAPVAEERHEALRVEGTRTAQRPELPRAAAATVRQRSEAPKSAVAVGQLQAKGEPPRPAPGAPAYKPSALPSKANPASQPSVATCDLACLMQRAVAGDK